jgi:ribonucleoside-diphosphate reductase alpha chain
MSKYNVTMQVINRHGDTEEISFDEIKNRIKHLINFTKESIINEPLSHVSAGQITLETISKLYDGITTRQLDNESAKVCASLETIHHHYGILAGRILSSDKHKHLYLMELYTFIQRQNYLNENIPNFFDPTYIEFINKYEIELNNIIDPYRDYLISYFGYKTLEKSYLIKLNDDSIEIPQDIFLRVAIAIHHRTIIIGLSELENSQYILEKIAKTYNLTSLGFFTHATPTLFNAGTKYEQMSSCYLLGTEDSLDGIFKTIADTAKISKWAGGIGIHISNIRARGSKIKSTNGKSDGIIPMLKVYNETARYANQCLTPDTWVYSLNNPKQMKDITTDDYLITIDGSYKKVNEIIINNINKEIISIKILNSLFPIKVTKEHDIYLIKNQTKMTSNSLIINRLENKIIKPEFYSVEEITEDDIVGFPIPTYKIFDVDNILDLDFYKFYGIMLVLGNISADNDKFNIIIELSESLEIFHINEIVNFIKNYLLTNNIEYSETKYLDKINISWLIDDNLLLKRNMLYIKLNNKIIPTEFLHLPKNNILKIFEGLLITCDYNLNEFIYNSNSLILIMQLRYLLLRLNILTSGFVCNDIENEYIIYSLKIPKNQILSLNIDFNDIGYENKINNEYFEWNNILWGRIESITKINYSGHVYDFNMIDNHNYLTDSGLVHNSGKRKGSVAMYLEPWHADIEGFLDLKKNTGAETERTRDIFTALWIPDEFMRRVIANEDWYLMCPSISPGLVDVYDSIESLDFTNLYLKYISENKYIKKIKAQIIFQKIMESQIETGVPYILFKDNVNRKSNQSNIGIVKSSNLCAEITEVSTSEEYAVCNLGSIAVNKFIKMDILINLLNNSNIWDTYHNINNIDTKLELQEILKSIYDFDKLREVTQCLTYNLNNIIDYNFYPVEETKKSNLKNRPIGIGIQGLGDLYYILNIPYSSYIAKYMDALIMETIYFAALTESNSIAKIRGSYQTFNGSPFSQGILQFDLWNLEGKFDYNIYPQLYKEEWKLLKQSIINHGTSNSLLTSLMPTATTSQILGNNECFEPYSSNIYKRTTLAGEFQVINKYLVNKLSNMKIWNEDIRTKILLADGSIQNINFQDNNILDQMQITNFEYIKQVYKTIWEVKQKDVIDHSIARGPYIDQSQSMNLFFADSNFKSLYSALIYGWKSGLKTGCYYLRSKPAIEAFKYSIEIKNSVSILQTEQIEQKDCMVCSA